MSIEYTSNVLFLSTAKGEPVPVLYIPRGQCRFRQMGNDIEGAALIVYLSDKASLYLESISKLLRKLVYGQSSLNTSQNHWNQRR